MDFLHFSSGCAIQSKAFIYSQEKINRENRLSLKLTDWASIAEIVSSVAVVISLIFLIIGVKENTTVTRAAAYDRNVDALIAFREEIATNDDLAALWLTYETGEADSLERIERLKLNNLINWVFGNYEKAYFNHKYHLLGQSEWARYERQICINQSRLKNFPDLKDDMGTVVTDEFFEYMNKLCGATN